MRLPDIEVPLAQHRGLRPEESDILAQISGSSTDLSKDELQRIYSGPSDYLNRYGQAFEAAVAEGILLDTERPLMMSTARAAAARAFAKPGPDHPTPPDSTQSGT